MASQIPAHEYDVVVLQNRFPSFAGQCSPASQSAGPTASVKPLLTHLPALGRCEVVCFTSDHDASFSSVFPQRARTVVDVWADRSAEL